MKFNSKNSFQSLDTLNSSGKNYKIFNLKIAEKNGLEGISKLPKSLKVLLENLLRYEDDATVDKKQILALKEWLKNKKSNTCSRRNNSKIIKSFLAPFKKCISFSVSRKFFFDILIK